MPAVIPFEHIEGEGPVILFAHANGYPPLTYRRFFAAFQGRYRIIAPHHRPLWPDGFKEDVSSWEDLADDTLEFLGQRNIRQVIGVGHSLGAVTNLFAAAKQPDRFRAIVLIDPVFLPPATLTLIKAAPMVARRHPYVQTALKRTNQWASREEAYQHFRQKEVFAGWSDEVLRDFIEHGLKKNSEGVTLTYGRDWEAHIYSLPPQVWKAVKVVKLPTLAIRGAKSTTLSAGVWQTWQKRQPAAEFIEIPGTGHMIPMEQPDLLAQHITTFLAQLT